MKENNTSVEIIGIGKKWNMQFFIVTIANW